MFKTQIETKLPKDSDSSGAQTVAEVKEILQQPEQIPIGYTRLVLHVEGDEIKEEKVTLPSEDTAPPHDSDEVLVIRFVNIPGRDNVLVLVRKDHFYQDINAAANYLSGTTDEPLQYVARMIPPASTGNQRVFVEPRLTVAAISSLSRGLSTNQTIDNVVVSVEIDKPRALSTRVAAILHPSSLRRPIVRGSQRRELIRRAGQEAFRTVSTPSARGERRKRKRAPTDKESQIFKEINETLSPLLAIPRGEEIPDSVIESVVAFVIDKFTSGEYQRVLFQWVKQQLETHEPGEIWPIVHWIISEANKYAEHLSDVAALSETTEEEALEEGELAFYTVPTGADDIPFAQCECCQQWRPLKRKLTEQEEKEPWFCHSTAGGGMDIRGLPQSIQDTAVRLQHVRERLRYKNLPTEERELLEQEEKLLCDMMCKIKETEEETIDRISEYSSRVIQNPSWNRLMERYDEQTAREEKKEEKLSHLVSSSSEFDDGDTEEEEEDDEKKKLPSTRKKRERDKEDEDEEKLPLEQLPLRQQATLKRLRKGVGAEQDRELLESKARGGTQYIGGTVRDQIDFLSDVMEERSGEILQLENKLVSLGAIEREMEEKNDLIADLETEKASLMVDDNTREEEIKEQIATLRAELKELQSELQTMVPESATGLSLTEQQAAIRAAVTPELKLLTNLQNDDKIRLSRLLKQQSRDPMIPAETKAGEQNEVYVIQALASLADKNYIVHYSHDITPLAEEKKQSSIQQGFGPTAPDVVFALVDSDKYRFLGATQTPIGSPFVKLGKGWFLLRTKIRSLDDVDKAIAEMKEKNPTVKSEALQELRTKLTDVYHQNQVLSYALGGAFEDLANIDSDSREEKVRQLQKLYGVTEDTANLILQQFENHLTKIKSKSRADALKIVKQQTKGKKVRVPWWIETKFPIHSRLQQPPILSSSETKATLLTVPLPLTETKAASLPQFSEPTTSQEQKVEELLALVTTGVQQTIVPPVVRQKRKEKATTFKPLVVEEEVLPKKPKIDERCTSEDIQKLREEAVRQQLFIATQDEGLKKLCLKMFDVLTRTSKAEQFLRHWRTLVNQMKIKLSVLGINVSTPEIDKIVQEQVLRSGLTKEGFDSAYLALQQLIQKQQ